MFTAVLSAFAFSSVSLILLSVSQIFLGFDSWRIWLVLLAVPVQSMHVCVHVEECVLMIEVEGV